MLTIASYQDLGARVRLPGGGAGVARTSSSSPVRACVPVDAARDEEVGGDARVGRVMAVERGHTRMKPHLLPQEAM